MSRLVLHFENTGLAELQSLSQDPKVKQSVRDRAQGLLYLAHGKSIPEASKTLGVTEESLRSWVHNFNEKGIDGIRGTSGRRSAVEAQINNASHAVCHAEARAYDKQQMQANESSLSSDEVLLPIDQHSAQGSQQTLNALCAERDVDQASEVGTEVHQAQTSTSSATEDQVSSVKTVERTHGQVSHLSDMNDGSAPMAVQKNDSGVFFCSGSMSNAQTLESKLHAVVNQLNANSKGTESADGKTACEEHCRIMVLHCEIRD